MLRALMVAALLTAVGAHLGAPFDVAAGYAFAGCLAVWLLLPVARVLRRLSRRRRRGSRAPAVAAAPARAAVPAALTQINHYHYYSGVAPRSPAPPIIDPDVFGLPRYRPQQMAHDEIFGHDNS